MSSAKLEQMYQYILNHEELGIDSISIVKDGYLCYEKYFEFYNHSNIHNMFSVTKSVTSALIGVANSTGMIPNLDEPVIEIFANRSIQNLDARKEAMTIRHLLEMRSGLEWNEAHVPLWSETISYNDFTFRTNKSNVYPGTWINIMNPENDFPRQTNTSDWIQYVLDKPMVAEPGKMFYYNTGVTHLLSAIIKEKTGMNTEAFAKQNLFDPLNITNYVWWEDPSGLSIGGGGLWLTPNDMLKIGYLFLKNGEWNNTQILPEAWIQESTQNYNPDIGSLIGYGYQWWIDIPRNYYWADGVRGQYIVVKSDRDLIVTVTSWASSEDLARKSVIIGYILKAFIENTSTPVTTTTTTATNATAFSIGMGLVMLLGYSFRKKRKA